MFWCVRANVHLLCSQNGCWGRGRWGQYATTVLRAVLLEKGGHAHLLEIRALQGVGACEPRWWAEISHWLLTWSANLMIWDDVANSCPFQVRPCGQGPSSHGVPFGSHSFLQGIFLTEG